VIPGFLDPADATVECSVCRAPIGKPCRRAPKDKVALKPGFVHVARRIRRLLLTARARSSEERERVEAEAVKMVQEHLAADRVARHSRQKPKRKR
jgi:hypothetical protein